MQKFFDIIRLKSFRFINKIFGITSLSFSADGEDVILRKFLSGLKNGFYLDLGAHDHKDGSNTFYFYLLGWSGVCIDPLPGVGKKFKKNRPRDIFIDKAVVPDDNSFKTVDFNYFVNFPDNSTTSNKRILDLKEKFNREPSSVLKVETITISTLIKDFIKSKEINLLNIDIEGAEHEILLNLLKENVYPWVICVEEIGKYAEGIVKEGSTCKLLKEHSYLFVCRTFLSSIYVHSSAFEKLKSPYLKDLILKT